MLARSRGWVPISRFDPSTRTMVVVGHRAPWAEVPTVKPSLPVAKPVDYVEKFRKAVVPTKVGNDVDPRASGFRMVHDRETGEWGLSGNGLNVWFDDHTSMLRYLRNAGAPGWKRPHGDRLSKMAEAIAQYTEG
jgi:hypothetical protein